MSKKERGSKVKLFNKGGSSRRWRVRPGQYLPESYLQPDVPTNRRERRVAAAQERQKQRSDV